MEFVNDAMLRAFPKLNLRPHTFEDVTRVAKRERVKITICDYNPDILGYYCIRKTPKRTKKFIMINSRLHHLQKTFIGLHELGHHFLHAPISSRQWFYCRANAKRTEAKYDCEADYFALVAMIPLWQLIDLDVTNYEDIPADLLSLCIKRKKLWEERGV